MHEFFIIGHRGAAGEKFENSLSGFEYALTLDIDAIELDVRVHSGELWVMHDVELERLTGSNGRFGTIEDPGSLHLRDDFVDLAFVDQIQRQGVRVMVYTVNDFARVSSLKNAGVDGIFTDYPSKLLNID
jgi:glycerophosphoryl diester phosphodiesterase